MVVNLPSVKGSRSTGPRQRSFPFTITDTRISGLSLVRCLPSWRIACSCQSRHTPTSPLTSTDLLLWILAERVPSPPFSYDSYGVAVDIQGAMHSFLSPYRNESVVILNGHRSEERVFFPIFNARQCSLQLYRFIWLKKLLMRIDNKFW